jgi:hypothetical protein
LTRTEGFFHNERSLFFPGSCFFGIAQVNGLVGSMFAFQLAIKELEFAP